MRNLNRLIAGVLLLSLLLFAQSPLFAQAWSVVSSGMDHTIAVKTDGTLWAWGRNNSGQLGLENSGAGTEKFAPTQVGTAANWASVSCGYYHTLAVKADGTLWAWGENGAGQLGIGDTTNRNTPTKVGNDTGWASVSCGGYTTLAIRTDGTLWAWGNNSNGQLGLGNSGPGTDRNEPTRVGADTSWSSASCSVDSALALKTGGTLWAWGHNGKGQLGLGDTVPRDIPTQVEIETDWATVSHGAFHTFAVKAAGTLWAWGDNSFGQLGLGNFGAGTEKFAPTQVGTAIDWSAVFCGGYQTLVIKADGTLWASGWNNSGQLGLGDTIDRNTLTRVGTDTNWDSVSCTYHTLAVSASGTLWVWGLNEYGQLGIGDTTNRNTPTKVETFGSAGAGDFQIWNNAFNPKTGGACRIEADWPIQESAKIRIYDLAGRLVKEWTEPDPSTTGATWNGRDRNGSIVPNGVYFISVDCGSIKTSHPVMVLKK